VRFLSPESKRYHLGLEEVERMKEDVLRMKEDLRRQAQEARKEKSRYHALAENLEREKEQRLSEAVKKAEKKIENLIEHSKVEDVFRRHERLEQIRHEMPEIVKPAPRANGPAKLETAEDFAKAFPPGSKIFAATIGRDGVVQGQPNSKGEVPILSNSMRLMVPWTQLKPPHQASNPTTELVRRTGAAGRTPLDQDRTIDLRGYSMEDALKQLEAQLDTAALNQESRIRIVHGHGTETLKRGIRQYLSRSAYVKKWKAGTPETGGDGVTWAELRD
jgi:DNA mismatch repair protein MutS2